MITTQMNTASRRRDKHMLAWPSEAVAEESVISKEDWAEHCQRYGLERSDQKFIDELIAFYQLNKPQKSPIPSIPPAKIKNALRNRRDHTQTSLAFFKSKPNALEAAPIYAAASRLIREYEKADNKIQSGRPGRDAEILKVTIRLLNIFMILRTGTRIFRSEKDTADNTQNFAIWFFEKADPKLKKSTIKNAIKEYLRGWGEDEARYLLGEDKEFIRAFKKRLQIDPIEEYLRGWGEDEARYEEFHRTFEKRLQMHKRVLHQNFLNPEGLEKWLAAPKRKDIVETIAALGSETIDKLKKRIAGPEVAANSSR